MHPKGIEPSPSDPESNALSIKLRVHDVGRLLPHPFGCRIKSTALKENFVFFQNLQACLHASKIHLQACKVCRLRLLLDENAV